MIPVYKLKFNRRHNHHNGFNIMWMKVLFILATMAFLIFVPVVTGLAASPRRGSMPPLLFVDQEQHQQGNSKPQHHQEIPSTSDYGKRKNHPTAYDEDPPFKGPLSLSDAASPDLHRTRIRRYYLGVIDNNDDDGTNTRKNSMLLPKQKPQKLKVTASTEMILKTILDHLAYSDAPVDAKEVAESVEFYLRCGKRILGAAKRLAKTRNENSDGTDGGLKKVTLTVQDLCSGHGLTGLLFAACNPPRNRGQQSATPLVKATMIDRFEPQSHKILRDCITEVCPWIGGDNMVQFVPSTLEEFLKQQQSDDVKKSSRSNGESIVISTHACGSLTDFVVDYAVQSHAAAVAVMPCCYTGTDKGAPYGIRRALGVSMAADIRRSFFLQDHDYHVDFATIPKTITPMNRIIVAERRK